MLQIVSLIVNNVIGNSLLNNNNKQLNPFNPLTMRRQVAIVLPNSKTTIQRLANIIIANCIS